MWDLKVTTSLTKCIDLCLNWMLINYAHIYWTQQLAGLDRRSSMEILFIWYLLNSLSFIDLTNICLFDWFSWFVWLTFLYSFDWHLSVYLIDVSWFMWLTLIDMTWHLYIYSMHMKEFFSKFCASNCSYIFLLVPNYFLIYLLQLWFLI